LYPWLASQWADFFECSKIHPLHFGVGNGPDVFLVLCDFKISAAARILRAVAQGHQIVSATKLLQMYLEILLMLLGLASIS